MLINYHQVAVVTYQNLNIYRRSLLLYNMLFWISVTEGLTYLLSVGVVRGV